MKIYLYNNPDNIYGNIFLSEKDDIEGLGLELLGEIDLDIKKPKKIVKKEADTAYKKDIEYSGRYNYTIKHFLIPPDAKNIKCTYEVEE